MSALDARRAQWSQKSGRRRVRLVSRLRPALCAVIASSFSLLSCGTLQVSPARMRSLHGSIERAVQGGALACAPREIALARAHYEFAQVELRSGHAARAQRHISVAEQNLGAAQVLTPDRGCAAGRDEVRAIPQGSLRAPSAMRVAADGGEARAIFPLGAVKNADADGLMFDHAWRSDSASALTASQMSQAALGVGSKERRSSRLAVSLVQVPRLTAHLDGETRLHEALARSYVLQDLSRVVLSIGGFVL